MTKGKKNQKKKKTKPYSQNANLVGIQYHYNGATMLMSNVVFNVISTLKWRRVPSGERLNNKKKLQVINKTIMSEEIEYILVDIIHFIFTTDLILCHDLNYVTFVDQYIIKESNTCLNNPNRTGSRIVYQLRYMFSHLHRR